MVLLVNHPEDTMFDALDFLHFQTLGAKTTHASRRSRPRVRDGKVQSRGFFCVSEQKSMANPVSWGRVVLA